MFAVKIHLIFHHPTYPKVPLCILKYPFLPPSFFASSPRTGTSCLALLAFAPRHTCLALNPTASHRKSGSRKVMQAKKSNARCHFTSPKPILGAWIFSGAWKLALGAYPLQPPSISYSYLPLLTPNYPFWPPRGGLLFALEWPYSNDGHDAWWPSARIPFCIFNF